MKPNPHFFIDWWTTTSFYAVIQVSRCLSSSISFSVTLNFICEQWKQVGNTTLKCWGLGDR